MGNYPDLMYKHSIHGWVVGYACSGILRAYCLILEGFVFLLFLKSALGIVTRDKGVRPFLSCRVGVRG